MRFYEDIEIGEKRVFGSHTFSAQEIKAYAVRFDPQPFHVDEEAAARSHFGALCASGWHTASLWMRYCAEDRRRQEEAERARGETPAKRGPSPGFRELKWLKPVYVGDTISFASEIVDKRESASRPEWGLVSTLNTGINQHGELVLSFISAVFAERRSR